MILFRTICFALIFIFYNGYAAAQECEPDIRIFIDYPVEDIQFSANGNNLFVFGLDKAHRYDLERRQFDLKISLPLQAIDIYTINSDGSRIACVDYESREVQVVDFESGDVLFTLPYPTKGPVTSVEVRFSNDDARIVYRELW